MNINNIIDNKIEELEENKIIERFIKVNQNNLDGLSDMLKEYIYQALEDNNITKNLIDNDVKEMINCICKDKVNEYLSLN